MLLDDQENYISHVASGTLPSSCSALVENLSPQLTPLFWGTLAAGGVAAIVLTVGLTLLLGTTSHRKIALPTVWIGAAVLAAAVTVLVLILVHR